MDCVVTWHWFSTFSAFIAANSIGNYQWTWQFGIRRDTWLSGKYLCLLTWGIGMSVPYLNLSRQKREGGGGKRGVECFCVFVSPIITDNHSCMVQASELVSALNFFLIPDAANDFVTFTLMQLWSHFLLPTQSSTSQIRQYLIKPLAFTPSFHSHGMSSCITR